MKKQKFESLIQFLLVLLLSQVPQQCICSFANYDEAILSSNAGTMIQSINMENIEDGDTYGIGFWSMSIPLLVHKSFTDFQNPYASQLPEDGEMLMLMKDTDTDSNVILVSKLMDYENLNVQHQIRIINDNSDFIFTFEFKALEYEGSWIFHLILIQPMLDMVIVQINGQPQQQAAISTKIQSNFQIFLGGRGYFNQKNLNQFKGLFSQILFFQNLVYSITTFDEIINDNKLPPKYKNEQIVNIVPGLKLFLGKNALQSFIDHYGNKYILFGWVKYLVSDVDDQENYILLRMTGYLNYEQEKQLGDELFKVEVGISKRNPKQTNMIIKTDAYSMPVQQSFQQQFDLTFKGSQNQNYEIYQSKRIFQDLNSFQYYEGLQSWHYIQYEYGRDDKKMLFQTQFFNEIGLLREEMGNDIFGGSYINSRFNLFFGGDNFSSKFLQAEIYDFQMIYNYYEDKELQLNCHYSCLTCNGPLKNNCLSCDESSHRFYQSEMFECKCRQGFFEFEVGICTDQFYSSLLVNEEKIENNIVCPLGYFRLVLDDNRYLCKQCPQSYTLQKIYCAECLWYQKTWYLKPTCKYDYIRIFQQVNDEAYQLVLRDPIYNDVYFIGLDNELNLHPEFEDYCVNLTVSKVGCYEFKYYHLGSFRKLYCKSNYMIDVDEYQCLKLSQECFQYDSFGDCSECFPGQYLDWYYCKNCPSECLTCEYGDDQPYCNSCIESYALVDGQCQLCGNYCKSCQFYDDTVLDYQYLKCFRCVDDSKYFISFDGQTCHQNLILNCEYAFQVIRDDYSINTLNLNFQPKFDESKIVTLCGKCNQGYVFIFETNQCIKDTISTDCQTGIGKLDSIDQSLNSVTCLSSTVYQNDIVQFTQDCNSFNNNCQTCLQTDLLKYYHCLECESGYYVEKNSNICLKCPVELNCNTCYSQNSQLKDKWKDSVRAFYRQYIEKINSHQNNNFVQSKNINDYEILCETCQEGYRLHNQQCIPYCQESCKLCLIQENQYVCVQCYSEQRGRKLTLVNNYCIECPENCALCRIRTDQEISQINPLFNNKKYQLYSHQCLKSYEDQKYYYDEDLGCFVECISNEYENGCFKQIIIELTLLNYQQYEDAYSSLKDEQAKINFKRQNINFWKFFYEDNAQFSEFQNDQFYTLANSKRIKSLIIKIKNNAPVNFALIQEKQIQQIFSENIFSLINVEIEFNFQSQVFILNYSVLKIVNFNKVTIKGLSFVGFNTIQQQGLTFESLFPQTIILDQITFSIDNIITTRNTNFQFIIINLKSLYFSNLLINSLIIGQTEIFMKVEQTAQPKSLIFQNVTISNCEIKNVNLFDLGLNKGDVVEFDKIILQANFIQSNFIRLSQSDEIGMIQMRNINITGKIISSDKLFNFFGAATLNIYQFSLVSSILDNSSLIMLNRESNLEYIYFIDNFFVNNSSGIVNSDHQGLTIIQNISQVFFQNNNYSSLIKFIYLKKYRSYTQNVRINFLNQMNNRFNSTSLNYNRKQVDFSLITIQYDVVEISNILIDRGYGLNELAFYDCNKITIQNGIIEHKKFRFLGLHQYLSCQLKQVDGQYYQTIINIISSKHTEIKNLTFSNLVTYNFPVIQINSADLNLVNQEEVVILKDIQFNNNLILKTESLLTTALISIQSTQEGVIQTKNINLVNNILHLYIQNDNIKTAGLLIFDCPYCLFSLENFQLINNIITNSSSNIIYIHTQSVDIRNSQFINNNIFNYSVFQPHILWGFTSEVSQEIIKSIFQVKSQSGIGQISAEKILIINNKIVNTSGLLGGCLSIFPQGSSNIYIINNLFETIQTQFQIEIEYGGGMYVDSSSSVSLYLEINNNIAKNIFCRQLGGFLYLKSNTSQTTLNISDLYLQDVFAQQGSAFYIQYSKFVESPQILYIQNFKVTNSETGYILYLNKYSETPKQQDLEYLINNRSLIYMEQGSLVKIQDVKIHSLILEAFIILKQINSVFLIDIQIKDSFIQNNLITITSHTVQSLQLILNNLQLIRIQIGFSFNKFSCNPNSTQSSDILYLCLTIPQSAPLYLPNEDQNEQDYNNAHCLYNEIIKYINNQSSGLILLHELTYQVQIFMFLIQLIEINCELCENGLISFQYENTQSSVKVQQISSLNVQNSKCGKLGCINIYKPKSHSSSRILSMQEIYSLNYEFTIKNYVCKWNQAYQGTCIRIESISLLIQNSDFQYNEASSEGGSIYIKGNNSIVIENTIIQFNNASIGGGLYFQDQIAANFQKTKTKILKNLATIYSDNVASYPQKMTIQIKQNSLNLQSTTILENSTSKIEEIIIEPYIGIYGNKLKYIYFPAGSKLNSYKVFDYKNRVYYNPQMIFRIILLGDGINDINNNLENSKCIIQSRRYNQSEDEVNQKFTNNYTNIQIVYYNTSTQNYNLDEMIIYFDNQSPDEIVLQLQIMCDSIRIPIFNNKYPYQIINYHTNYKFRVNLKTFNCQIGEIKNTTSQSCQICDSESGLFSLSINSEKCEVKDDFSTLNVQQNQLVLRAGYWRPYFDTSMISYCINLEQNCLGGINEGDSSCYIGHIGSLCEQCDLHNTQGNGQYSIVKKFICGPCAQRHSNIILILVIFILTLIFLIISVSGNIKTIENFTKYQPFKILKSSTYLNKAQSGMLIKMLTNYFQIIVCVTTFQLQLSEGLNSSLEVVGNPLQTSSYSLDCFLVNLSDIEIQYIRIVWQMALPILYATIFISFYFILSRIKNVKFNPSITTTTLIYIYNYFQPNLVNGFIELVSYRNISGFKWIQANVSQRYDTASHTKWMFQFNLPLLILFSTVIPCFFFFGLFSNRKNLEKKETRFLWGYLYNEYKKEAYFWELIKIVEKELIILSLVYYQDSVVVKGVLVLFTTYLYQELNQYYQPYALTNLNKLDYYQTNICMITIGLAIGIYISQQAEFLELQVSFFFIIFLLNLLFLNQIITKIIMEYSKEYDAQLDIFKDYIKRTFPGTQRYPWLIKLLKNRGQERKNVLQQFLKLKTIGIPLARRQIQIRQQYLSQTNFKQKISAIDQLYFQRTDILEQNKSSLQRMISFQNNV